MFNLFGARPYMHSTLGELRRSGGAWRGAIEIDGAIVPLTLAGGREAPDADALEAASTLPARFTSMQLAIASALFEHAEPYLDSLQEEESGALLASLKSAADVWQHSKLEFVSVLHRGGSHTVELGYAVSWDEEHTLGVRFQGTELIELCGSVLAP
jgi:hypothetical protein